MEVTERLIEVCEKLPGFYGYRPSFVDNKVVVDEVIFRLPDKEEECEYIVRLFFENQICKTSTIDARYSDASIARILDTDPDFQDIVKHKNKIVHALNQFVKNLTN